DAALQSNGTITHGSNRIEEIKKTAYEGKFTWNIFEFTRFDHLLQKEMISEIECVIEEHKPDAVFLPSPKSCNQDHRVIFQAGYTALRPLPRSVRHFVPYVLEYEEPYRWYMEQPFEPNFYFPLTRDELKGKADLIRCHASQLRNQPSTRS